MDTIIDLDGHVAICCGCTSSRRLPKEARLVNIGLALNPLGAGGELAADWPIPAYCAPTLVEMHALGSIIAKLVHDGNRVIIVDEECGAAAASIAAAYLAKRYTPLNTIIEELQSIGAELTVEAYAVVEAYAAVLRYADSEPLWEILKLGARDDWGQGELHASRVAQLAVRLWNSLAPQLGLDPSMAGLLAVAGLLHDIGKGRKDPGKGHDAVGAEIVLGSSLLDRLPRREVETIACLIRNHRNKGDPREDPLCRNEQSVLAAALLKIADGLDYSLDQSVHDARARMSGETITIDVMCREGLLCSANLERAREKAWLLERETGQRIAFTKTACSNCRCDRYEILPRKPSLEELLSRPW